jgi:uncharacterized membrane protein
MKTPDKPRFLKSAALIVSAVFLAVLIMASSYLGSMSPFRGLHHNKHVGMITRGVWIVQELPVQKSYLLRIDLFLAGWDRINRNNTEIVILNSGNEVLFRKLFDTEWLSGNRNLRVPLDKCIRVEEGEHLFVAVGSPDGDELNSLTAWTDTTGTVGQLYRIKSGGPDIASSISSNPREILPGSICMKTYESDLRISFNVMIILLITSLLLLLALSVWLLNMSGLVSILTVRPEKLLLTTAGIGGLIFILVSPPTSGPDEVNHFFRSYQVSNLKFFKADQTFPSSLRDMCNKADIGWNGKTSLKETASLWDIKLNPTTCYELWTYDLFVPYIPQALGIALGRLLGIPPVGLYYLGRLFNLLSFIFLIFWAIRIAPFGKWVFFLLAVMPMTLYLSASLSHDGVTIGLSCLLFAQIMRYAFDHRHKPGNSDLILLFMTVILLAFCKLPYSLIGLTFLIIPVRRIGSFKRYLSLFLLLAAILVLASPAWYFLRSLITQHQLLPIPMMYCQIGDPNPKMAMILVDILHYTKLLVTDLLIYQRDYYLTCFYGTIGWLDLPLPTIMATLFVIMLALTSATESLPVFRFAWYKRIFVLMVVTGSVFLIQTAAFLYFTPASIFQVSGVQGRYLIPLAPLLFVLFYQTFSSGKINARLKSLLPVTGRLVILLSLAFSCFSLLYTYFLMIDRYY